MIIIIIDNDSDNDCDDNDNENNDNDCEDNDNDNKDNTKLLPLQTASSLYPLQCYLLAIKIFIMILKLVLLSYYIISLL